MACPQVQVCQMASYEYGFMSQQVPIKTEHQVGRRLQPPLSALGVTSTPSSDPGKPDAPRTHFPLPERSLRQCYRRHVWQRYFAAGLAPL